MWHDRGRLLRIGVVLLLVLALAGPSVDLGPRPARVELYVDGSLSLGAAPSQADRRALSAMLADLPRHSQITRIDFAAGTPIRSTLKPGDAIAPSAVSDRRDSNLAKAVQAASPIGDDRPVRLLVSDGRLSTWPEETPDAWWPLVPVRPEGEAGLLSLAAGGGAEPGTWRLRAGLMGPPAQGVTVQFHQGRRLLAEVPVSLNSSGQGWAEAVIAAPDQTLGSVIVASLANAPHGLVENDRIGLVITPERRGRALYVTRQPDTAGQALLTEQGFAVSVVPPDQLPGRTDRLASFDLVVLANLPLSSLRPSDIVVLGDAVAGFGIGLVALGGPDAFSAGGYLNSPLEELLPVISEDSAADGTRSVVFVIDSSGSMAAPADGGSRFQQALRAVETALAGLRATDRAGLVFFDREASVFAPLGPRPEGLADASGQIARQSSGGTDIAVGLNAGLAQFGPDAEPSEARTLVLITDGQDEGARLDVEDLRASLAASRVDLLPILISDHPGSFGLVTQFAAIGGRDPLVVRRSSELPRLTRSSLDDGARALRLGPVVPRVRAPLPGTTRQLPMPEITGHPVTRLAERAEAQVVTPRGHPLVATGRHGAGRVLALPAGLNSWTAEWLADPSVRDGLGAAMAWAAGLGSDQRLSLRVTPRQGGLRVTAELTDRQGEWHSGLSPGLMLRRPGGSVLRQVLPETAPGRYQVDVAALATGRYDITVTAANETARRSLWRPSLEARALAVDGPVHPGLESVRTLGPGAQLLPEDWPHRTLPLRGWFAGAALLLYLSIVTSERWPWRALAAMRRRVLSR